MKHLLFNCTLVAVLFPAFGVLGDDFNSDGVPIHYTVAGSGEPVILIHGLYSSAEMNWALPGIEAALAKHYQVIPGPRGRG